MAETLAMTYEAVPFTPTPERYEVVSRIIREVAMFETLFTDYERACVPLCANTHECPKCMNRLALIGAKLADPRARVWEVWKHGEHAEIVGIAYLTDIIPGGDAKAHYVFWDKELLSKTQFLEEMIQWCFTDHPDWIALRRLTVEAPTFGYAFIRHAHTKLGFGGDFKYRLPGKKSSTINVEGVRRGAIRWNNNDVDMVMLGRTNG